MEHLPNYSNGGCEAMKCEESAGKVQTKLNGRKGIFCEVCRDDCSDKHLITLQTVEISSDLMYQHVCVQCAKDLITCLQRSLMNALLTDKEIPEP